MFPPPLAWVPAFCHSMGGALGSGCSPTLYPTVNPLVHTLTLEFGEDVGGSRFLQVWNLLQMYAGANDCVLQGKLEKTGRKMTVGIVTKRLRGMPKNKSPLG